MRTSQWVHRGMGPAGTCEAGPAAYSGYMVAGGPAASSDTAAYSGHMRQEGA